MIDKKTLEGIIDADTSTAAPEEEEGTEVNLSNAAEPTLEEQENATVTNITEETSDTSEPETELGEDPNPVDGTEPGVNPNPDEAAPETPVESNTESDPNSIDPETGIAEAQATKTFSQSQVDEIAGKVRKETREKVLKDTLSRYGVNTMEELDDLMADAQRFATAKEDFAEKETAWTEADNARNQELLSVKERVALLESGIDRNRFEDARLILRGKGLEVTAENIAAELATHPEWKKQEVAPTPVEQAGLPFTKNPNSAPASNPNEAPTTIAVPTLGNNSADNPQPELSERERALRMFKV